MRLSSEVSHRWWYEHERTDGRRRGHEKRMIAYLLTLSGIVHGRGQSCRHISHAARSIELIYSGSRVEVQSCRG